MSSSRVRDNCKKEDGDSASLSLITRKDSITNGMTMMERRREEGDTEDTNVTMMMMMMVRRREEDTEDTEERSKVLSRIGCLTFITYTENKHTVNV
jgi:hypothetical protein